MTAVTSDPGDILAPQQLTQPAIPVRPEDRARLTQTTKELPAKKSQKGLLTNTDEPVDAEDEQPLVEEPDSISLEAQQQVDAELSIYGVALNQRIQKSWWVAYNHRTTISQRLLACLRASRSEYDPGQLAQIMAEAGGDPVYVPLTAVKMDAAFAWLTDVLLQPGMRAWGLEPRPIPELPDQLEQAVRKTAIANIMQAQMQMGQQVSQEDALQHIADLRDAVLVEARKRARAAADRMEDVIETTFDDGGFTNAVWEFLQDYVTYPAAFIEGPVVERKTELTWGPNWEPKTVSKPTPMYSRISPFDAYPSPMSASPQEGDFCALKRYTRDELSECIGMPNYNGPAIRRILDLHYAGGLKYWLFPETQRRQIEDQSATFWIPDDMVYGIRFWGKVQGSELRDWGVSADQCPNPYKYYEVEAIKIGPEVIRCAINTNPLGRRPIYSASWAPVPGAIWGNSLPEQCDTPQRSANAAARAIISNLGIASGPQVMVNTKYLPATEDITTMFPWKVWQYSDELGNAGQPVVSFFQPPSNASELLEVMDKFSVLADDATGVPRYAYGNDQLNGAAGTASGLSMLMNSSAKGLRAKIGTVDKNAIALMVENTFLYHMIYTDDHTIKGDCRVVPRGAAAVLIKEHKQQQLTQWLATTANPVDQQIIGPVHRANALRESVAALELSPGDLVPTDKEILAKVSTPPPPPQPTPDVQLQSQVEAQKNENRFKIDTTRLVLQAHKQGVPLGGSGPPPGALPVMPGGAVPPMPPQPPAPVQRAGIPVPPQ